MDSLLKETGVDWLGVVISRRDVERLTIDSTLDTLQAALSDAETVRLFQGRVDVVFEGWNDDPRELYEIPEVRTFLHRLDAEWPYWLYFLSTELETLRIVTLCLCDAGKAGVGLAQISPTALSEFLMSHFDALNGLFVTFGLDDSVNEQISERVAQYFWGGVT